MRHTAACTRYSSDNQKPTSTEDQLRRCREVAAREGLILEERYIYSDNAVTGKAEGTNKRAQYQRMLDAIECREVSVVIADEISRLTRDVKEGGKLMGYADDLGVRFITADGIDTDRDGWRTMWLAKLMLATVEVESTGHRTSRGMLGQLQRGYQIAQAPYGYRAVKDIAESGRVLGTLWTIYEPEATVVRQMFEWRKDGLSVMAICARLEAMGTTTPGARRVKGDTYWRSGTVYQLLRNRVYRGVFVWNGSSFAQTRARKRNKTLAELPFDRPNLRLVSDDLWYAANVSVPGANKARAPRGSGKHMFSGLVRCGDCHACLSVGTGNGDGSMFCPQCEQERRVKGTKTWLGYTSVNAVRQVLYWALETVFSGEVRREFNCRLAERLLSGPDKDITACNVALKGITKRIESIQGFMLNPVIGPVLWEPKLEAAVREHEEVSQKLRLLKSAAIHVSPETVALQKAADPLHYLRQLLQSKEETYKTRATLRRLLSRFEFVARPEKGVSVFRIAMKPGVTLAEASDTNVVDAGALEFEVTARTSAKRPVVWGVEGKRIQ